MQIRPMVDPASASRTARVAFARSSAVSVATPLYEYHAHAAPGGERLLDQPAARDDLVVRVRRNHQQVSRVHLAHDGIRSLTPRLICTLETRSQCCNDLG